MRMPVKNFRIFVQEIFIFRFPKTANNWYFRWGVCDKATVQTAQFWAMGIVLGPSQHPKDVPFVSLFWWGTYGLGAISPRNQQISAKFHISNLQNYKFQRYSPGGMLYCLRRYALCY